MACHNNSEFRRRSAVGDGQYATGGVEEAVRARFEAGRKESEVPRLRQGGSRTRIRSRVLGVDNRTTRDATTVSAAWANLLWGRRPVAAAACASTPARGPRRFENQTNSKIKLVQNWFVQKLTFSGSKNLTNNTGR
jgi:hypothetical protein